MTVGVMRLVALPPIHTYKSTWKITIFRIVAQLRPFSECLDTEWNRESLRTTGTPYTINNNQNIIGLWTSERRICVSMVNWKPIFHKLANSPSISIFQFFFFISSSLLKWASLPMASGTIVPLMLFNSIEKCATTFSIWTGQLIVINYFNLILLSSFRSLAHFLP